MSNTKTFTQIYTPVTHSNGERLVQITNEDGAFCGWADGRGKFDVVGTWEIDENWTAEQAAELGRAVQNQKQYAHVKVVEDGVSRRLEVTL